MVNNSQIVFSKFLLQNNSQKRNNLNIFFILKILIFIFYFLKFETISPKSHSLTLNPKYKLVSSRVKMYFYSLIKLILVIIFIENYFCDKNLKNDI